MANSIPKSPDPSIPASQHYLLSQHSSIVFIPSDLFAQLNRVPPGKFNRGGLPPGRRTPSHRDYVSESPYGPEADLCSRRLAAYASASLRGVGEPEATPRPRLDIFPFKSQPHFLPVRSKFLRSYQDHCKPSIAPPISCFWHKLNSLYIRQCAFR